MDWDNVKADVECILPYHYTPGRNGSIKFIVVHYNYGNLTVEDCYNIWLNREASAHYQVESSGRIGQLVWDTDTAWATGDWYGNNNGISIEHANIGNEFTSECIHAGAHLTAALCKYYGLGEPSWGNNVFPHNYFSATSCPGALANDGYREWYMSLARDYYNGINPDREEDDMTDEQARQLEYVYNQLKRTDTAGHDNPDGHDFYGRLQIVENQVNDIYSKLQESKDRDGWSIADRIFRCTKMLKAVCGIDPESTDPKDIPATIWNDEEGPASEKTEK